MSDFAACWYCGKKILFDQETSWRGENCEAIVVSDSAVPYAVIMIGGLDVHVCEECYRTERCSSLDEAQRFQLHYEFALTFIESRDFAKAKAALVRAYDIAPSADVTACLGLVAEHLNERAEAIRYYGLTLSASPQHAMALSNLKRLLSGP